MMGMREHIGGYVLLLMLGYTILLFNPDQWEKYGFWTPLGAITLLFVIFESYIWVFWFFFIKEW